VLKSRFIHISTCHSRVYGRGLADLPGTHPSKDLQPTRRVFMSFSQNAFLPTSKPQRIQYDIPSFAQPIPCTLPLPGSTADEINDSGCVRFFPERFFATAASDFQQSYDDSKQVQTEQPVVHLTLQQDKIFTANQTDECQSNNNAQSSSLFHYPSTISYFHVRKCGGTTMFRALTTRALQVPYESNSYNQNMIETQGIVQNIYDRQYQTIQPNINNNSSSSSNDAIIFSFVRDPVMRFLTSVGQMLHMGKIQLFPACTC